MSVFGKGHKGRFLPRFTSRMRVGIGLSVLVSLLSATILYGATYRFLIKEAEQHIQNVLLTHRGLHLYIQRVMHPTYYDAMKDGEVSDKFYAPQILSSSYMVRVTHGYINEERERANLPQIYYKMAANNPRNPVNKADAHETRLIQLFNDDRSQKEYREVLKVDGKKYLYYAVPFLETTEKCLKCHGKREDAPAGLRALYPGDGGFGEHAGTIRAVESIRAPLGGEMALAAIIGVSTSMGFLAFGSLLLLNGQLRRRVLARTAALEQEITERKQIAHSLVVSEERFRQIAANAKEWVWETDAEGAYTFASPVVEEILGYKPEEVIGQKAFSSLVHPDGMQELRQRILPVIAAHETFRGLVSKNLSKNGKTVWLSSSGIAMLDADGHFLGYRGADADITEQREAEEALRKNEEQLRQTQRLESVGRLAGSIAHDFNNVLTAILCNGEIIQEDLPPESPVKEGLDEIMRAGERARDLTRQLLAFSRKQILEIKTVDVNAVVRGMEKMVRRLLGEDIEVEVRSTTDAATVKADPSQLEQVLLNLCLNARDAMPEGGHLTIAISTVFLDEHYEKTHPGIRPGPYVLLSVSDTGVGMDEKTKGKVFEPFFTTKEKGKGTGLGLATVHGIIKQHGGDIWVYSEPGRGSTFKIYLPRTDSEADHTETTSVQVPLRGEGEVILVMEDDAPVREIACQMLVRLGYSVLNTPTIEACMEHARSGEQIDLLLTDVIMPGMNGRQVRDRVWEFRPELKTLFMSGYTEDVIAHHGVLDDGIHFITKPFTEVALSVKVREVLDRPIVHG